MSNIERLQVTGIVRNNSIDYIKHVFNAFNRNEIVVPINRASDITNNKGLAVASIIKPEADHGWYAEPQPLIFNDNIAQISFTSGTQGEPKGIMLTHSNLADVINRLNHVMSIDSTIREYIGIPIYHSFGFGRVRACLSSGGQIYIPPSGFNPIEIKELLKNNKINAVSAVPTLWRVLLNDPRLIGEQGKKVKWIEIGSQYMSMEEKEKMKNIFPNAMIV
ncbi:MAG: long-chain fatty acid--CoA ligase, partial [Sedimenticola sp.]|nr:long-chain fatty acid--CoA ligase [Sedimenticola sp.]